MSPELLVPGDFGMMDDRRPTRQSDCYALGMVIYEVLSGQSPYHKYTQGFAICKIIDGKRPKKPRMAARLGFTGELWEILEQCWLEDRNQRPDVDVILSTLNAAIPFWRKRKSMKTLVSLVFAHLCSG